MLTPAQLDAIEAAATALAGDVGPDRAAYRKLERDVLDALSPRVVLELVAAARDLDELKVLVREYFDARNATAKDGDQRWCDAENALLKAVSP